MSLLDDIREEQHEFLLEKGNLLRKQVAKARWVDGGYVAQTLRYLCPRCADESPGGFTLFRESRNEATGEIVRTSVPRNRPPGEKGAFRWEERFENAYCAPCTQHLFGA